VSVTLSNPESRCARQYIEKEEDEGKGRRWRRRKKIPKEKREMWAG
jgi:hypothetical protein